MKLVMEYFIQSVNEKSVDYSFPLKEKLIWLRDNISFKLHKYMQLSQFIQKVYNDKIIQRNETTFILQFISRAIQDNYYQNNIEIFVLFDFISQQDISVLSLNGKIAFYITIYNLLHLIVNYQLQQYECIASIEITVTLFMFLLENNFNDMQEFIIKTILQLQFFSIKFDHCIIQNHLFQSIIIQNLKYPIKTVYLAINYLSDVFGLSFELIKLSELEIPISQPHSLRFTTEKDYSLFNQQYQYLMSQIPESVVQISYEQLDSVQSLIQFLEQQSFLYNTSWEKKLFLESGSCTIALFLLILGAKFQPQKSGRFSYTGFGISENYRLSGFRTSLLIIIQRTLILNPASWDWSVAMNVIQIFIIYQMGDGETAGCQEIVALCLDQWKQSQGCIQILQQIVDTN